LKCEKKRKQPHSTIKTTNFGLIKLILSIIKMKVALSLCIFAVLLILNNSVAAFQVQADQATDDSIQPLS